MFWLQLRCHHPESKVRQSQRDLLSYDNITIFPNSAKCNLNVVTNLTRNPIHGRALCCTGHLVTENHSQFHTQFRSHPEHPQQHLLDKQQSPRKNRALKYTSTMMPYPCIGARCKLAYGKSGCPLNFCLKQKLRRMVNGD